MSSNINAEFRAYVDDILANQKGRRIYDFTYNGKRYWIKQPEKLSGIWLLLKPHPKESFKNELETLLDLSKYDTPVPEVVYYGDDFFVLEDAGDSVPYWMNELDDSEEEKKYSILTDVSQALIAFHQKGLVHGRPAIRDITWQPGKVTFLDFETHSNAQNSDWLIVRDMLFFFDSLCRESAISDDLIKKIADYYEAHCDPHNWDTMIRYMKRFHWLYYLLLPFKPIAKKDLIAIYRLFELIH